ncbi:helix-turn-helix transcriptional regulator [Jannaschia sp. S6380]|uniref:winged helix-turn-helix transcriptional regulator n=1 Tax=Jannaschia sp. S6380 TaxID=2926408 RepID=UPI001FF349A7|nr:helix-turn-helix domain-containing protein [Jannaschia sp. S6380]MCK0167266.1 helix-turn-helix transcriptional regulator [Jannaschia sp. S6380]
MTGPDESVEKAAWREQVGDGAFSANFHAASELIGKRWTGAIIRTLFHGKTRFREIADAIPGLSDRLLSERLKELRSHGVIEPRGDGQGYALTEKGRDLRLILREIAKWAHRWREGD